MEAVGLFWRPVGEPRPRPTPWWSRAVLCEGYSGPLRYLFRSCLVCAPIAREVLVRCFDLEAGDRAYCSPYQGASDNPEPERRYEEFLRGYQGSEAQFYPRCCPAVPRCASDFATYGNILACLPAGLPRRSERHRLRLVRNTVAHGHYISWGILTELKRVGDSLFGI
jgi:hypothetical protein